MALSGGAVALVAVWLWRGEDYWNFSEGVYLLTSRLFAHGADLYGRTAAAQPPGIFLFGAGVLEVHDSVEFMRLCVGLLQLAGGAIAAVVAWRLSGSRAAALAAPALVMLTPWAVHESGALTPEPVAIPLLMGGALLVARPRTAAAGGALAALAVGVKLPFLIPLVGIVAGSSDRRRAMIGAAFALAVSVVAGLALFGSDLFGDVVTAQLQSGHHAFADLPGLFAQTGWNLIGLVLAALVLVRVRARDADLGRAWLGLGAGLLVTVLTFYKDGTGLNILVPVEAGLVPAALAGAAAPGRPGRLAQVAIAFVLIQTAALVAFPARTIVPFLYPLSERGAWGRSMSAQQVDDTARRARDCPPGVGYSGTPYLAFVAHRPPAGGQPDLFLVPRSPRLTRERAMVEADPARCP